MDGAYQCCCLSMRIKSDMATQIPKSFPQGGFLRLCQASARASVLSARSFFVFPSRGRPVSAAESRFVFCPADADEPLTGKPSLGGAGLGWISRAGRGAKASPVASPALTKHEVIVGRGAHGVKHVGFIGDLELWCGQRKEEGKHTKDLK